MPHSMFGRFKEISLLTSFILEKLRRRGESCQREFGVSALAD